jgi:3',5'-cyclic AMP phosphodiesterase CpdA
MRTIAQISDLHFGRHDPAIVDALLDSLRHASPDLVVVSGDFTQRARRSEFRTARKFLDGIPQPKLVVPGNHDVPLHNVLDRWLLPFAKYDRYIGPAGLPDAFYADDEIAVLGLNTARRMTRKSGRVSLAQIVEMRQAFSPLPPRVFRVLVTHHPLGSPTGIAALELARRSDLALRAAAESHVHLMLSGHHHRASSGEVDAELACRSSVLIVHAGTAVSTRTRGEGNTYNLLSIHAHQVSIKVMKWQGAAGFQEHSRASFAVADGRWRAAA